MTDLIVHMGLPKAGSTTLQERLLKNEKGYLGKVKKLSKDKDYGKQLIHISPIGRKIKDKEKKIHDWYTRVQQYIESNCPDIGRVIASHEEFSQRVSDDFMNDKPISNSRSQTYDEQMISFLHRISKEIWTSGSMKVLLILRNQPEWLASLYVQKSKLLKSASQRNFESQVNEIIENKDEYLDWSKWIERLYNCFGSNNVCVLLLEDMGTNEFWERLTDFLQIETEHIEKAKIMYMYANKRKCSENIWKIPSIRPIKYIKMNYKDSTNSLYYKSILGATRIVSSFMDITRFDRRRGRQIELHDDLRNRILEYCRPFNERLEKQLGISLKERGYL